MVIGSYGNYGDVPSRCARWVILSLTLSEFHTRKTDIAVQWMLTLGSNISLLRHVHIRVCKLHYDESVGLCYECNYSLHPLHSTEA